jgi:hypothetical protein
MSDKSEMKSWDEIDAAAVRAGGYLAAPKRPLIIEYDYRAMTEYCQKNGVSKMDLSEDELAIFEYAKPLVYS